MNDIIIIFIINNPLYRSSRRIFGLDSCQLLFKSVHSLLLRFVCDLFVTV